MLFLTSFNNIKISLIVPAGKEPEESNFYYAYYNGTTFSKKMSNNLIILFRK